MMKKKNKSKSILEGYLKNLKDIMNIPICEG